MSGEASGHRHLSSAARRPDSASRNPPFRQYQGETRPESPGNGERPIWSGMYGRSVSLFWILYRSSSGREAAAP